MNVTVVTALVSLAHFGQRASRIFILVTGSACVRSYAEVRKAAYQYPIAIAVL